jgi:hypothetical protein
MTWQDGLFLDPEDPRELAEDPFRCVWCKKPLDASRMHESAAPEPQIIDAVLRMRRGGRTLQDVLHYVRLAWEREAH